MSRFVCSRFLVQSGLKRIALALLFTLGFAALAHAQDGAVDPDFDVAIGDTTGNGSYGSALSLTADGKIYIGGIFKVAGGRARLNLARLNPDGSADPTFDARLPQNVDLRQVEALSGGRVLIWGYTQFIRYNSDGSIDRGFIPPSGVRGFALDASERVLVFGTRISKNGVVRWGLARLTSDGSIDTSFNPGIDVESTVTKAVVDPFGRILVAGILRKPNGFLSYGIVRLLGDGTLDGSFTASDAIDSVFSSALPDLNDFQFVSDLNGRVLVSPLHTKSRRLIRLNTDGGNDTGFDNTITRAGTIALDPSGKILVGQFVSMDQFKPIQRLEENGQIDPTFTPPLPGFLDFRVYALKVTPQGKIVFASNALRTFPFQVGQLNNDGTTDQTFQTSHAEQGSVNGLTVERNNNVLLFGRFSTCGTSRFSGFARIHSDGTVDQTFNPAPTSNNLQTYGIRGIVVDADNRILVVGEFDHIAGSPRKSVARLNPDGTNDPTFNPGSSASSVYRVKLGPDGKIYLGGFFSEFDGVARPGLVRLNSNGSVDLTFNPAAGGSTFTLDSSGRIVLATNATFSNPETEFLRLNADGSLDPTFTPGIKPPTNSSDFNIAGTSGNRILVGGYYRPLSEPNRTGLVRLNSDGAIDTTFTADIPTSALPVNFLETSAGKLLVNIGAIIRLNSDGSRDSTFLPGERNQSLYYTSFGEDSLGRLFVGGEFKEYDGIPRASLVRLISNPCTDFVTPTNIQTPAEGGSGVLNFTAPGSTCPWTAEATVPWISVSPAGTGNASIGYTVAPNDGPLRSGSIRVNRRVVTILQASTCAYTVTPSRVSFTEAGGTGSFSIACGNDCRWEITLDVPWILITGPTQGQGNADIPFRILPNFGPVRNSSISIGNRFISFSQKGRQVSTPGSYRASTGFAYLRNTADTGFADTEFFYGQAGDIPISGDWDGTGGDSIGIYRNGVFYLRNANSSGFSDIQFAYGQPGDIPIAGDWNGDGIDTIGVIRGNRVLLRNSNSAGPADIDFNYGTDTDIFIVGDWNGDGIDTIGAYRQSNGFVYLRNSNSTGFADTEFFYGLAGDRPIAGDWDGDGIDTIGVVRGNRWLLRNSNTSGFADIDFNYGTDTDIPIVGDWNGIP